jgi:hypothetical protein
MGVTLDIILLRQLSVQICVCCACAEELGVAQWAGWELCTGSMAQLSMDHQQVTPCQPESIQVRDLQLCEQLEVGVLNGWGPEPCLPILCTVFTRVRGVVDRTDLQAESPGEHVEAPNGVVRAVTGEIAVGAAVVGNMAYERRPSLHSLLAATQMKARSE